MKHLRQTRVVQVLQICKASADYFLLSTRCVASHSLAYNLYLFSTSRNHRARESTGCWQESRLQILILTPLSLGIAKRGLKSSPSLRGVVEIKRVLCCISSLHLPVSTSIMLGHGFDAKAMTFFSPLEFGFGLVGCFNQWDGVNTTMDQLLAQVSRDLECFSAIAKRRACLG